MVHASTSNCLPTATPLPCRLWAWRSPSSFVAVARSPVAVR